MSFDLQRYLHVCATIFTLEVISFVVTPFPLFNTIALGIVGALFAIVAWKSLQTGLLLLLTELTIGSFGYLLAGELEGVTISLRMLLFVIFLGMWIIRKPDMQRFKELMRHDAATRLLMVFGVFVGWGVLNGILFGNDLRLIFQDANGYLYFALIIPALTLITTPTDLGRLFTFLAAGITMASLKVIMLVYIFSHPFQEVAVTVYRWVRDSGVGEITRVSLESSFHRIFIQSQMLSLALLWLSVAWIIWLAQTHSFKTLLRTTARAQWLGAALIIASILASFSRSFWLGAFVAGIACVMLIGVWLYTKKLSFIALTRFVGVMTTTLITALVLLIIATNFPFPGSGSFGLDDISQRARSSFNNEAAISSRWNLLGPLEGAIAQGPLLGTGFGTTVTYESNDPRIKTDENPQGVYTTSTFEWGYHDMVIEMGLIAVITFITLLGVIAHRAYWLATHPVMAYRVWGAGILLGIITLMTVHAFSPYFNHPLGIGYLIIAFVAISTLTSETKNPFAENGEVVERVA